MMRRLLAAAVLAVVVPPSALARPAVVRVFEAPAHAEPSRDADVLHVFAERSEVSVSEDAQGGWRRVRLQDGSVGWIEESSLKFPEATTASSAGLPAAAVPASSSPPATGAPDLRPRIYVKGYSHFADLVSGDPALSPRAQSLARRRKASIATAVVGGLAMIALVWAAAAQDSPDPGDPSFDEAKFDEAMDKSEKLMTAGVSVGLASVIVGLVVHPRRGELLDVVNAWNVRHPDQQFAFGSGGTGRATSAPDSGGSDLE
jgi:hypothetical protein